MRIIIDLDSTVADLLPPWLARYNKEYNDNLTVEQITTWQMHELVKPECGANLYKYLTPDLFASLKVLPGARESVQKLRNDGHEIAFVTAAPFGTADAKIAWTMRWFDVKKDSVIACDRKYLFKADVLIDDSPQNIVQYRKEWPNSFIATIAWPFNECAKDQTDIYAHCGRDTAMAWEEIYAGIVRYCGK